MGEPVQGKDFEDMIVCPINHYKKHLQEASHGVVEVLEPTEHDDPRDYCQVKDWVLVLPPAILKIIYIYLYI